MMDFIFRLCVNALLELAELTGTTYNEINVIIFCFLMPAVFIWLLVVIYRQRVKIKELSKS